MLAGCTKLRTPLHLVISVEEIECQCVSWEDEESEGSLEHPVLNV